MGKDKTNRKKQNKERVMIGIRVFNIECHQKHLLWTIIEPFYSYSKNDIAVELPS